MNLIIVEDNELVLQQLQRLIGEMAGIHIAGLAPDEESAVFMINLAQPEAVLLDLSLASGTGLKVLKRVREAGCRARVLVLTNHGSDAIRKACESFGIDGFYDKSREVATCLDQLASWLPFSEDGQR